MADEIERNKPFIEDIMSIENEQGQSPTLSDEEFELFSELSGRKQYHMSFSAEENVVFQTLNKIYKMSMEN